MFSSKRLGIVGSLLWVLPISAVTFASASESPEPQAYVIAAALTFGPVALAWALVYVIAFLTRVKRGQTKFWEHPQYAVVLAGLLGLAAYFASDFLESITGEVFVLRLVALVLCVVVLAVPVALVRFLWKAGSKFSR